MSPGIELETSRTEGRALTNCVTLNLIYFHCCSLWSATDDLGDIDLLSLLLEEEPSAPDTANTFGKFNLVINVTQPVCPPLNRESRYSKKT